MGNYLFDGLLGGAKPERIFADLEDGRQISYGDLLEQSGRLANVLTDLGARPGDRIAVQVQKSMEAVMLYLACARSGLVFLPLNTAYLANELDYFLGDAGAKIFVCDPSVRESAQLVAENNNALLETLGTDGVSGSLNEKAQAAEAEFNNAECSADSLGAILYTSGTTGRSKGAMLTHDNLLSNAVTLVGLWRFTDRDVLLHALPIFHTHGLFVAINVTLVAGGSLFFMQNFNVDRVLEAFPRSTTMMGVPTFYTRLLEDDRFTRDRVAHMRLFVSGSAPLLAETHVQFEQRTGMRILERYGMTETNMNTSNPYAGERRAGTVGFALPDVELRVCDPDSGEEVEPGTVGMLEVKGPNVFAGYWNMPEKTAEEFRDDGFFITGDLGRIDGDGYVHIVGRGKDLIISGGYNIYPKEVELLLDAQPGVLESAVVGVPHPDFGEGVVGVLVAEGEAVDTNEIASAIREEIARFKQPKFYAVLDELPRNTMGKVQKNLLRDQFKDVFQ